MACAASAAPGGCERGPGRSAAARSGTGTTIGGAAGRAPQSGPVQPGRERRRRGRRRWRGRRCRRRAGRGRGGLRRRRARVPAAPGAPPPPSAAPPARPERAPGWFPVPAAAQRPWPAQAPEPGCWTPPGCRRARGADRRSGRITTASETASAATPTTKIVDSALPDRTNGLPPGSLRVRLRIAPSVRRPVVAGEVVVVVGHRAVAQRGHVAGGGHLGGAGRGVLGGRQPDRRGLVTRRAGRGQRGTAGQRQVAVVRGVHRKTCGRGDMRAPARRRRPRIRP